ncbi:MAG: hypothetical protein NVS3B20_21480 [Polyangiales bacterium]
MMHRRNDEAAERSRARHQREDDAPRLGDQVPDLQDLGLEIAYVRGDSGISESKHVRRVVVDRAPALFVIPCGDRACKEGGHDVTFEVMRALRAGHTHFEGNHTCSGNIGTGSCNTTVHYVGTARFSNSAKNK